MGASGYQAVPSAVGDAQGKSIPNSCRNPPKNNREVLAQSPPVRVEGDQVVIGLAERLVALVELHRPAQKQRSEPVTGASGWERSQGAARARSQGRNRRPECPLPAGHCPGPPPAKNTLHSEQPPHHRSPPKRWRSSSMAPWALPGKAESLLSSRMPQRSQQTQVPTLTFPSSASPSLPRERGKTHRGGEEIRLRPFGRRLRLVRRGSPQQPLPSQRCPGQLALPLCKPSTGAGLRTPPGSGLGGGWGGALQVLRRAWGHCSALHGGGV